MELGYRLTAVESGTPGLIGILNWLDESLSRYKNQSTAGKQRLPMRTHTIHTHVCTQTHTRRFYSLLKLCCKFESETYLVIT